MKNTKPNKIERIDNVELIEVNEQYNKVLYWFFSYPNANIGLNELCKNVKISKNNANRIVNKLVKEGFLTKEIIGKTWRIKCNLRHEHNKTKKIAYNIQMVYKSRIIERIYKQFKDVRAIILFGSYRKGDDNEKSDVDIAVNLLGNKELKIEEFGIIEKFGYRRNVTVNLYLFSNKKINLNLFSNIVNGIVLDGFLEVKK